MEIYGIPCSYLDESSLWHEFFSYVESLFPFPELALNLSEINVPTAKNVQVSFFPHNDAVWENKDHPLSTYKKPFVYVFLLCFEDYEEFKKSTFAKVTAFITAHHKINEWVVVYYPNVVIQNEISYKAIRKNFDRLRLDFIEFLQEAEPDRLLKFFEYMPEKKNDIVVKDECIEEFKKSMRTCLEISIQKRTNYILKEIDASYGLKENPEWDYLQFFTIKENMALILEMLNLHMDSLQQYDELNNLFFEFKHISKIKFSANFNFKLEVLHENWDSINPLLMNYSKLPYRMLIYNNKISEFTFLQYVFARKIYLLKKLDMDFEAIERFKFFIKETKRVLEGKGKFFSIQLDDNEENNLRCFDIFCNVWAYQISNGLAQIYKNNLIQANAAKITALTNNISYLKNLAKFHLQKIGLLAFNLGEDFFHFGSCEQSLDQLIMAMNQENEEKQPEITGHELFEKFYSKLSIIHDKELFLALKGKDSYFTLLFRCYNEIKSIYMLNYNRRLAFWVQLESLKLAVKAKKISENPSDLADLSLKMLRNWKDLELKIKLIYCVYLIFTKNVKNFVKCMLSLLTVKREEFGELFRLFLKVVEKIYEQRIEIKKLEVISLNEITIRQNSDNEINLNVKVNNMIELPEFYCRMTVVLEEKDPEKNIKKIDMGDVVLIHGVNEIAMKKTIDFFGFFKINEVLISFSKIDLRLPDDDETILIFQKNLKLADLDIKDIVTMETLSTIDILCQNINKYLAVISNINFEFCSGVITLDSKHGNSLISISEVIIFFKDSNSKFTIQLQTINENGKLIFNFHSENRIQNMERIYFIFNVDAQNISSSSKEEIIINLEFYDEKGAMTCILEQNYDLNFERIFEIKFNHYSNPLFSFSNIQLKNLSFYSFLMLAFFLDNQEVHQMEKRLLNPLEIMGIILKNQNLNNISSGFFEFLLAYNHEKIGLNPEKSTESLFISHFQGEIRDYMERKLIWRLPEKFLFDLTKTHKLSFLFQIDVEAPKTFFVGIPGKLKFVIQRNLEENLNIYNHEHIDYFLSLEKFSNNWLVVGSIQEKIRVFDEKNVETIEFSILPLSVGYVELPKFQIASVKNNILLMVSELKMEDMERIETEHRFIIKNSELMVNYINGNNVLVCSYEKTKADYAVFV